MRDIDDVAFNMESIDLSELSARLVIAHDMTKEAAMSTETKTTIIYALCVVKTLVNENPDLLANISGYLAARELKRRAKKEDA